MAEQRQRVRFVGLAANRLFGERESMIDVVSADKSGFGTHGERRSGSNTKFQGFAQVASRSPIVAQRLRGHPRPAQQSEEVCGHRVSLAGLGIEGHGGAGCHKRAGQIFSVGLLAQKFGLGPHQCGVGVSRRLALLTLA